MLGWALGLWQLSLGVVTCLVPSQCWWGCVCVCVLSGLSLDAGGPDKIKSYSVL